MIHFRRAFHRKLRHFQWDMLQHAPEGAEGLQEAPGRSELEDVHSDRPLTGHLRLQARGGKRRLHLSRGWWRRGGRWLVEGNHGGGGVCALRSVVGRPEALVPHRARCLRLQAAEGGQQADGGAARCRGERQSRSDTPPPHLPFPPELR